MGAAAPALLALDKQARLDDVRAKLDAAWGSLRDVHDAILHENAEQLRAAIEKYRAACDAATTP